jgi:hypothetical protein
MPRPANAGAFLLAASVGGLFRLGTRLFPKAIDWIRKCGRILILAPSRSCHRFHWNAIIGPSLPPRDYGGMGLVERCDEYRRFAEACVEMARHQDSPQDRAVLLQMAYIWSRLAEQAAALARDEAN